MIVVAYKLYQALQLWFLHDGPRLAAALSYYALFAVAPLLFSVVSIASLIYSETVLTSALASWGQALFGSDLTVLLTEATAEIRQTAQHLVAPVIGVLIFIALSAFGLNEVTSGLHDMWDVSKEAVPGLVTKSIYSVFIVPMLSIVLVMAVLATSLLSVIATVISSVALLPVQVSIVTNMIGTLVLLSVLFMLLYRLTPGCTLPWPSALRGGAVAAILFLIAKSGMEVYLTLLPATSVFGAAGSVIALLLWIYVSGAIFYYGAAYSAVDASRRVPVSDNTVCTTRSYGHAEEV
jgi:membrane protein